MSDINHKHSELRILHIAAQSSWRGGEQQVSYLIKQLDQYNCLQWVLCAENSAMSAYCEAHGIPSDNFKKHFLGFFINPPIIREICNRHAIDIIHVHDSKSHTLAFISALLGNRRPIVVNRRVDFPVQDNFFSRWKYNNKYIYKYICVSEKIKEILAKGVKDHSKLEVVHSGIDISRFANKKDKRILRKEFKIGKKELIIGNIAALADHKDYFTFIDTAQIIKSKGFFARYLIVGDGPLKEEIEEYATSKELKNDIIFTGFRNDIADILPEFDIFLFTSKTEGLGTSLLDAMACHVAIVTTNAGGIPELITHEKHGLMSEVADAEALAHSTIRILHDDKLRNELIEKSGRKVLEFTTVKTAHKVYKIYLDISSTSV